MDTTDYHCWCAVFMLPYSLNCKRTRRMRRGEEEGDGGREEEKEEGEEDGEWVFLYIAM